MELGLIGTGLMGQPMARRLLDAGHRLWVYNRTREKTSALACDGALVAETPEELVAAVSCVVVMVSDAEAVRNVLLNSGASGRLDRRTVLQMSTIAPDESRELAHEVGSRGAVYLEAPVLGSVPQAAAGSLIVMVGGDRADFDRVRPVLAHFGPAPRLIGPVGHAAALKLALNQLIASLTAAFSLSLALVQRSGVELEPFMEVLRASALYAPTFDKKLDAMLGRDFARANFPARLLLKDLRLCKAAAAACGLDSANLDGVEHLLLRALELGHADSDYSSLYEAVVNPAP